MKQMPAGTDQYINTGLSVGGSIKRYLDELKRLSGLPMRPHMSPTCSASGLLLLALTGLFPAGLGAAGDTTPPRLRILSPAPDTVVAGEHLAVEIEYSDPGSGIAPQTLHVRLGGKDYAGHFDQHSRGADGQIRLPRSLPLGEHLLRVEIADRAGNVARTETAVLNPGLGWLTIAAAAATPVSRPTAVTVSADGSTVAYGLEDGTIHVWRATGSKLSQAAVLKGHRGSIMTLAMTEDGKVLASGGEDRTVRLWKLVDARSEAGMMLGRHGLRVTALAFSPDGMTLASGSADRTIRLWSLNAKPEGEAAVLSGHTRAVTCLAYSHDGRKLVSGSADGAIRVWNISQPAFQAPIALIGHILAVVSVAVSPDGRTLVSASKDRSLRVWDLSGTTPTSKTIVEWLDQPVILAALLDNELMTIQGDNRVALWDLGAGAKRMEMGLPSLIDAVSWNGSRLVTHHQDGHMYLLKIDARPANRT